MHLEAEARIKTALSKKIKIDLEEMPLTEVIQFLGEEWGINIQLDIPTLEEVPVDTSELVTAHAADITARSALEFVLFSLDEPLTWHVQHEMMLITTLEESDAILQTMFYDVTDLVLVRHDQNELSLDYVQLKEAILDACDARALWMYDGGEGGSIEWIDTVGIHGLVIRQTMHVHHEIEVVLEGIGRMRSKEPAIFKNFKVKTISRHPGGGYF